jgi:G3E family GTPase
VETLLQIMEAIITIVGFLGSGKTTLLKKLIHNYVDQNWNPYVILNDYENAGLDAQQFLDQIDVKQLKALSGSLL